MTQTPELPSSVNLSSTDAHLAVIGLGYVGLPLAAAAARAGMRVTGIDVDERKIASISAGRSYIPDVSDDELAQVRAHGSLNATTDYAVLADADAIFICVPTPFDEMRAPDLQFVIAACEGIAHYLRPGHLIVLQSTTFPGTTEEVVQPILEKSGLKAGEDFNLAFSPERIDPGQTSSPGWDVSNTPKVVGGLTPQCTRRAADLLLALGAPVHPVSTARAAEMSKLLENIYRSVNIALVNELALLAERMKIDFWEVIEAAKTKPFGFMPFYPGPGVGGHCIPVDPYYLSWKARAYDFYTKFIELAAEVNQAMPYHIVDLVGRALGQQGRPLFGAKVIVLGVAFKPDIDDARNSPAERIIELLMDRGATVTYHDPFVPAFTIGGDVWQNAPLTLTSIALTDAALKNCDCVVVVTGHHTIDYQWIVANAPLIVDSCNATGHSGQHPAHVIRMGAPS